MADIGAFLKTPGTASFHTNGGGGRGPERALTHRVPSGISAFNSHRPPSAHHQYRTVHHPRLPVTAEDYRIHPARRRDDPAPAQSSFSRKRDRPRHTE